MADSLRDQLLKSGIAKLPPKGKPASRKKGRAKPSRGKAGADDGEMDLGQAWAMRARAESSERKRARAEAETKARERKERLQRLRKVLDGKALNKPGAEHARHFEYGGKIRRVYVDDAQLKALNAGQLGVVQLKGSHVVVERAVAEQVRAFAPGHIALLVDSEAPVADDGVPDDLTW